MVVVYVHQFRIMGRIWGLGVVQCFQLCSKASFSLSRIFLVAGAVVGAIVCHPIHASIIERDVKIIVYEYI